MSSSYHYEWVKMRVHECNADWTVYAMGDRPVHYEIIDNDRNYVYYGRYAEVLAFCSGYRHCKSDTVVR